MRGLRRAPPQLRIRVDDLAIHLPEAEATTGRLFRTGLPHGLPRLHHPVVLFHQLEGAFRIDIAGHDQDDAGRAVEAAVVGPDVFPPESLQALLRPDPPPADR